MAEPSTRPPRWGTRPALLATRSYNHDTGWQSATGFHLRIPLPRLPVAIEGGVSYYEANDYAPTRSVQAALTLHHRFPSGLSAVGGVGQVVTYYPASEPGDLAAYEAFSTRDTSLLAGLNVHVAPVLVQAYVETMPFNLFIPRFILAAGVRF